MVANKSQLKYDNLNTQDNTSERSQTHTQRNTTIILSDLLT